MKPSRPRARAGIGSYPLLRGLIAILIGAYGCVGSSVLSPSVDGGTTSETDLGQADTGRRFDAGLGADAGPLDIDIDVDAGPLDSGSSPSSPPAALSTRSLTSHDRGSDPRRVRIEPNRLVVDLTELAGAEIYRATLDPYLVPEPQRRRGVEVGGARLALREPRRLSYDATEVVRQALAQGVGEIVFDTVNLDLQTASLDVLCSLPAPASLPPVERTGVRHQAGDTMITFAEHEPEITTARSTYGAVQAARARVGPDRVGKTRYRIYRLNRPFDDLGDVVDAQFVDEIAPLSGWADRARGFEIEAGQRGGEPVEMLPVDNLNLAPPGTGIYVRRHTGNPATAYYMVSLVLDGAESFQSLSSSSAIEEQAGDGMSVLSRQETFNGPWINSPDVNMRLDYYVRWAGPGEHSVPNRAFHYRVGLPLDPVSAPRPAFFQLHPYGGSINDWAPWPGYADGAVMVSLNLQHYNSYTAYHEGLGTLLPWDEGTAQPFAWARSLAFLFQTVVPTYQVDRDQISIAGFSMGGAGTQFWGMRSGHLFSHLQASVGNSIPAEDIRFEFEQFGYGPFEWQVGFSNPQLDRYGYPIVQPSDGVSVWDYFDIRWWLSRNPEAELPYLSFANGVNDPAIAWPQAWANAQAIYGASQPHQFLWGQDGHDQSAEEIDLPLRRNQAVVAFSAGSLDDSLGDAPEQASAVGQRNQWYRWQPESIVDEDRRFSVALRLRRGAPGGSAVVSVTPRRAQRFRPSVGTRVTWSYGEQSGRVSVGAHGVLTIPGLRLDSSPTPLELSVP